VVHVISITDTECKLENLGKVCDTSQGKVEQINPKELTTNFKGILEKKVVATTVQATMLLHPLLRFKTNDDDQVNNRTTEESQNKNVVKPISDQLSIVKEETSSDSTSQSQSQSQPLEKIANDKEKEEKITTEIEISRQVQDIGNVFDDSKIYFEYVIRKELLKEQYKELKDVIFQVQIHYARPDGAKMLRVITQKKPITRNKEELIKSLDMDVIAANASRKSARLCEVGDYEAARANNYSQALWMNRNAVTEEQTNSTVAYVSSNLGLDSLMQRQQMQERDTQTSYATKFAMKKSRARQRKDDFSAKMYLSKKE